MKKLFLFLIFVVVIIIGFFLYPKLSFQIQFSKLEKKVVSVNQLLEEKKSLKSVQNILQKKAFFSNNKVENTVDQFLFEITGYYEDYQNILTNPDYQNLFVSGLTVEQISDKVNFLIQEREKLSLLREKVNSVQYSTVQKQYMNDNNFKFYQKIFKSFQFENIQSLVDKMDSSLVKMEKEQHLLQYLMIHPESWQIDDGFLVFLKRNDFMEYSSFSQTERSQKISFQLVKDTIPPEIYAQDITIFLQSTVSLDETIQCIDEVDGSLDCIIQGEYDNQKVGNYPIEISSVDQSGNESHRTIQVKVIQKSLKPYKIDVIRNQNIVIVYGLDDNGDYTQVVKVFVCSTGRDNATPTGIFSTTKGGTWGSLYGGVWGQYTTRIVGDILFHSVPYFSPNKGDLEWEEYNKLGTQASLGCVRLTVRDVKWIFNNCPSGTTVHIYDGDIPNGVSKPSSIFIDASNPNRGWDPTDDDSSNPWNS